LASFDREHPLSNTKLKDGDQSRHSKHDTRIQHQNARSLFEGPTCCGGMLLFSMSELACYERIAIWLKSRNHIHGIISGFANRRFIPHHAPR
jgi:hypothetical protein